MLALCYASPTLCDLAKHWQALVNMAIQAKYAQCQQIQMAMAYGGLRLRGGQISQCLEDEVQAGRSITEALRTCNGDVHRPPDARRGPCAPGGAACTRRCTRRGRRRKLHALARSLLGEVTLMRAMASWAPSTSGLRPPCCSAMRAIATTPRRPCARRSRNWPATGQVSDATLRAVSVPGQPLPRAALDALVTFQQDPTRFDSLVQKLTTGLAITRLTWECHDLQDQLAASTEANQELTDEQRRLLEKRLEGLQRDLSQVIAKKEVLERHLQPALEALLTKYTAVQDSATRAGLRAPAQGTPVMPYRTQSPAGYGR